MIPLRISVKGNILLLLPIALSSIEKALQVPIMNDLEGKILPTKIVAR